MASYYDKVLEDFDTRESEASYDEGILDDAISDEASYDEASYDEGFFNKRRPVKIAPSLRQRANFGKNVSASATQGNFVTKTELRNSLNSISNQVNDLKKSSLTLASSLKRLDDGYEKVVKSIAKKDRAQDNVMSSTTMMSLMGTLVNKPTLNTAALTVKRGADGAAGAARQPDTIELVPGQDPIQVDLTKTLLFTMLPSMMSGSSSNGDSNNSMMMMMMVLLLGSNKSGTGTTSSGNDNTVLLMLPMMMMMNKK